MRRGKGISLEKKSPTFKHSNAPTPLSKTNTRDPDWLTVSITDTGVGIPEENLEKIFEPLFTSKAKGIGLGMAISKAFVEGYGGFIEVNSSVGKGSTFIVKLPIGKK
jgi:signal transduction histidine kinase